MATENAHENESVGQTEIMYMLEHHLLIQHCHRYLLEVPDLLLKPKF